MTREPVLVATAEQQQFRAAVREFLVRHAPESAARALMATTGGYDAEVWALMAGQLGLPGLVVPAEHGGGGFGYTELALVLEEMGRALLCAPFLATAVLGTGALLVSGDAAACGDYLPRIADGSLIATVAARWQGEAPAVSASAAAQGFTLTGSASYVVDGAVAGLILVAARTAAGEALFAVESGPPGPSGASGLGGAVGLTRTPIATLDQTRKLADLDFQDTPARLIGADGAGAEIVRRVRDRAAIGLAAEQVGGAQRVLESAVDYARTRIQFGVPIGSFQAIKHMCADVLVAVESARSAAGYAAWALDHASDDVAVAASMAKACCSEAFTKAAMTNIQVHGGIGFTWEHSAHLYFKRAKSGEVLFGSPRHHRRLLAEQLSLVAD